MTDSNEVKELEDLIDGNSMNYDGGLVCVDSDNFRRLDENTRFMDGWIRK